MTTYSPNPKLIRIDVLYSSSVENKIETLCKLEIAMQSLNASLYHHSQCSVLRLLRAQSNANVDRTVIIQSM